MWTVCVRRDLFRPNGFPIKDFFDGKIDAKAVLDKYKEEGFDANQDFPGNFLWEELYQARDNAK